MGMGKKKMRVANNGLPQEIIESILTRLPVKSVLRFRCVSKPWRSLLDDPVFVDRHFTNLSNHLNNLNNNKKAVFLYPHKSLNLVDFKTYQSRVIYDDPLKTKFNGINLWGSCNGLVCMTTKDNSFICLWNPSTRKRNIIPSKSFHGKPSRSVYGFCSNASVKDYEVVEISLFLKRDSEVTVYSLRRNSWQRIQVFPYAIPTGRGGVIINGALHWKAHRSRKNGLLQSFESVIIAYDAGGESFREVPYPDHLIRSPCGLRVATLDGNLCVVSLDESTFELWVMKEYGTRDSWTKQFIIGRHAHELEVQISCFLAPLCFIDDGETLVLDNGCNLLFFELKSQTLRRWPFTPSQNVANDWSKSTTYCYETTTYIESLVDVE